MASADQTASEPKPSLFSRLRRRHEFGRRGAAGLAVLAVLAGGLTYGTLFGSPTPPDGLGDIPPALVLFDLAVLLLLIAAIGARAAGIWVDIRKGSAGAGLHKRLATWFAAATVIPSALVAGSSMLFFDLRFEGWFSDRAQTAVSESVAIAEALIHEHSATIRADALAMAKDLNRVASEVRDDRSLLTRLIASQAGARGLSEALVFDRSGTVLARTGLSIESLIGQLPISAIDEADAGQVVAFPRNDTLAAEGRTLDDKSAALIRLEGFVGAYQTYLYIARFVEPSVAAQVERALQAADDYKRLAAQRFSFELTFGVLFFVVAVLMMLAAVWLALLFSTRMASRLGSVVAAAETIGGGDLRTRVAASGENDEIDMLGRTFNRMAGQLESQQGDLVRANRTLDERRRFMETVLSGVTAGVIGADAGGVVDLVNPSALRLLDLTAADLTGRPLAEATPALAELLHQAQERPQRIAEGEVTVLVHDRPRIFFARVSAERHDQEVLGYVATFDDISDLVAAQRTAVWADVARRIAHEIRNPLTPIQLSAERLKRLYLERLDTAEDRETFSHCTDTIIRQVGDIGRMIDEFSSFARMPRPSMKEESLPKLVSQSVFDAQVAHPDVVIVTEIDTTVPPVTCDRSQIGQVMTNLLNNACQAIAAREAPAGPGRVVVRVSHERQAASIAITDNGVGLPVLERERLTEPYVTTREKGTGLGLAIVRKIMEDHSGLLHLGDNPDTTGAQAVLTFPLSEATIDQAGDQAGEQAGDQAAS